MRPPVLLCLLALLALPPGAGLACGGPGGACAVPLGSYQAAAPADWDGESPLGLLLYFHGYASSGTAALKNAALVSQAGERGLLLVAPNGIPWRPGGPSSWAHVGSPSNARDELAFVDQVLADAAARWPLDRARRYVAGFSQGGSMAWDVACYRGREITGVVAVAGAFWDPLPDRCPAGAVALRHIHGTADGVVPMAGRPIGAEWHQGDVLAAMAIRRRANACPEEPDATVVEGRLTCRLWNRCASGKPLSFCLHEGGHAIRAEWVGRGIDWLESGTAPD